MLSACWFTRCCKLMLPRVYLSLTSRSLFWSMTRILFAQKMNTHYISSFYDVETAQDHSTLAHKNAVKMGIESFCRVSFLFFRRGRHRFLLHEVVKITWPIRELIILNIK